MSCFRLGGSSGGARPKILTQIDGEEWIIKFPSPADRENIGRQEYEYSLCARKCGIPMAETRLFPSKICDGYFGTKRFDRRQKTDGSVERVHMLSVSAVLETSHRIPNLDYEILMKLTLELTKDFSEVEKLYRLMCFNVFAHNRDDHSKNFTYLYEETEDQWRLSPAYDLTYSSSIGGGTCDDCLWKWEKPGNERNSGSSGSDRYGRQEIRTNCRGSKELRERASERVYIKKHKSSLKNINWKIIHQYHIICCESLLFCRLFRCKLHSKIYKKTRRHSIDFCHFWRYNEAVCEYVSSMPRADAQ